MMIFCTAICFLILDDLNQSYRSLENMTGKVELFQLFAMNFPRDQLDWFKLSSQTKKLLHKKSLQYLLPGGETP